MFRDRTEAGRALAAEIARRAETDDVLAARGGAVVVALPRGGVPVGLELARALGAPLDVVLVRKIGVPWQPELAAGALVDGDRPEIVRNEAVIRHARIDEAEFEAAAARQLREIERRRSLYTAGPRPELAGRTVFVVDDGIATGSTALAALRALRRQGVRALVLAVPVAPPDSLATLAREADRVVAVETPADFMAVGAHYARFDQVEDAEVVRCLEDARAGRGEGPER